ncbi:hypothetical protein FPV67DRAFT_1452689 [Lyophyllum atratum]|nr:hypothetical protein FPV67DRAFT_1452689 [Lyophyllum atratum]
MPPNGARRHRPPACSRCLPSPPPFAFIFRLSASGRLPRLSWCHWLCFSPTVGHFTATSASTVNTAQNFAMITLAPRLILGLDCFAGFRDRLVASSFHHPAASAFDLDTSSVDGWSTYIAHNISLLVNNKDPSVTIPDLHLGLSEKAV